ncbi:MAG: phage holin family protein [Anaerolineae bacterium]|jgi:putative membrane protein
MKIGRFIKQFNWRFLLVRILMNAIALAITAAVTPKIYFVDRTVWSWLLMALMLGVLNALLKPILQFLTLPFIFVTYGLVVVLVNSLLLWLLSVIFPNRFAVENLLWALLGGLVLGLISSFLESLLGLTMPIVPEEETALRRQLEEEARGISWNAASRRAAAIEQQALEMESTEQEANAGTPAEPDDEAPAPNGEAESSAPVVVLPGQAAAEVDRAPATDPVSPSAEEQQEDGS